MSGASEDDINLGTCYRFFIPLIFMTELNMISKSVINAFLARMDDSSIVLAAFHSAFTLYYCIASGTEVCLLLTLSYMRTRRALGRLLRFMAIIVAAPWVVAQSLAFTPLGDLAFGILFGISDAAVAEAKTATFLLSLSAPILVCRSICFGLLMIAKKTIFITWATLARLASLAGSLAVLPLVLEGAAVGAGALVFAMFCETAVAAGFARRFYIGLPEEGETPPTFWAQWRFSWPLMLNSSAEMGMVFVISVFLGRLPDPDLALAAFAVVYGLSSLLLSPLRNLVQSAQTLVRRAEDRPVLLRFALHLILFFGAVAALLFHTPLDRPVLSGAMGLEPALEAYCAPAMQIAFLMASFWGLSAVFRGLLAGARDTSTLAISGLSRIAAAALVAAAGLFLPGGNGAVIGLTAWMAGYGAEAAILALRVRRLGPLGHASGLLLGE